MGQWQALEWLSLTGWQSLSTSELRVSHRKILHYKTTKTAGTYTVCWAFISCHALNDGVILSMFYLLEKAATSYFFCPTFRSTVGLLQRKKDRLR